MSRRRRTTRTRTQLAYGGQPSLCTIRRVWAAVTTDPRASGYDIARSLGVPSSSVYASLRMLRDAGYVDYADATLNTRTVVVPFVEVCHEPR